MSETIGFIGLGHLGLPMVTNLLNAGYALRVYNRTASKAESLGYGKRIAEKAAPFGQSKIPLKDVGLFKKTAQQVELPTPIASLLSDLLRSDEARA